MEAERVSDEKFEKLEKEALSIIAEIANEKQIHSLSYRKGYRLIIIGSHLGNESYKLQGKDYLKKFDIKIDF